jgi:hypothetical protein
MRLSTSCHGKNGEVARGAGLRANGVLAIGELRASEKLISANTHQHSSCR